MSNDPNLRGEASRLARELAEEPAEPAANRDDADVRNYPVLEAWLKKIGARRLSTFPERPRSRVEVWAAGGASFVVRMYARRIGYDVYTALPLIQAGPTLEDAEQRLGLV